MRIPSYARLLVLGGLTGALACASNTARTDDDTAVRRDTMQDTSAYQVQTDTVGGDTLNQQAQPGVMGDTARTDTSGYQQGVQQDTSMYRDTSMVSPDTSMMNRDTSMVNPDTSMYRDTSMMRTDTSGYQSGVQQDTSSGVQQDTSMMQSDTSSITTDTSAVQRDSTQSQ